MSDATFAQAVLKADGPVLVDFWTPDCVPCRKLEVMLMKLDQALEGRIKVVRLNPIDNPEVASRYEVRGVPTLLLFKDGKLFGRQTGFFLVN